MTASDAESLGEVEKAQKGASRARAIDRNGFNWKMLLDA
jgi:hypothetical protein